MQRGGPLGRTVECHVIIQQHFGAQVVVEVGDRHQVGDPFEIAVGLDLTGQEIKGGELPVDEHLG